MVYSKQTALETHTDQMTPHYLTHQQYRTRPWTDDRTSVHTPHTATGTAHTLLTHQHQHLILLGRKDSSTFTNMLTFKDM